MAQQKQYTINLIKRTGNKYKPYTFTGDAWDILMVISATLNKQKFTHWLDYFVSNKPHAILEKFCDIHYKEFVLKRYFRLTVESIEIVDTDTKSSLVKFNPRYLENIKLTQQNTITNEN